MNSSANGYNAPGVGVNALEQSNGGSATLLLQIEEALKLIHDPRCTNDARHQASTFLEDIKADDQAPSHGFTLACDRRQNPFVRHYALSLLEYATKHKWAGYSDEQANTLRQWVLQLAQNIAEDDPSYLRNKTAQLWVEIAKRTWAAEWMDMDELLVRLWDIPGAVVYKEFVLFVLETLSDDVFNGDDTVAALREGTLSKACVEIFTPAIVLVETFPNRERGVPVRYGEEGWLVRMGELLNQCLGSDLAPNTHYESCAARILAVYKSVMPWVVPRAVASASSVQHMCKSLASPSVRVQLAAVESLHALYCRLHFSEEEFVALICPMYTSQSIELLRKLFEWSIVMDPHDIDDQKYLFAKKFSEMMSNLGSLLESRTSSLPPDCDVSNLLRLFLAISQSQSFVISIPILVTWTRLLRSVVIAPAIEPLIVPLLELCTSRLIRYENLPEDTDEASLQFLIQDLDSIPERHAFLGNYRRYCSNIIELVVRQKHKSAIEHILSKVNHSMLQIYDGQRHFSVEGYSKHSMPVLRLDAQCTIIEAALKGYMKWLSLHGSTPQQDEQARTDIENNLEEWCSQLLSMDFKDPIIQKRVLQLTVAFATTALDKKVTYIHKVLDHILKVVPDEQPGHGAYTEAVKELQTDGMHELQRLALKMPDELLDIYEPLQESVYRIINSGTQDRKRVVSFQTFLFTIIHRTTKLNQDIKIAKLSESVIPIQNMWLDAEMTEDLKSFNGFCRLLGLDRVKDYFISRPTLNRIQDWGSHQLDDEGQAIQRELDDRLKAQPLRTTKSVLGCSLEKIEKDTAAFEVSKLLWGNALQDILPNLLKFLSHAHAFHNPENWSGLPTEMRPLVRRILMDRFWQAGISEGSKDDFYNRVTSTKSTMEGFASSIRGSIRTVREASYAILWCMSRLDTQFYGIDGLPGPLANALFADAHSLSTHQFIALLNVVRSMVDDCPVEFRAHFIPPLLAACFQSVDAKCTKEWEQQSKKQGGYMDGDSLTEEMKEESILRQLTHAAVMMIGGFLDPARPNPVLSHNTGKEASTYLPEKGSVGSVPTYPSLRKFCLTNANILEPLLLFMTHAIRMRDTRCCGVVLRVFRSIVPEFLSKEDGEDSLPSRIRYYISTQVLEACVTSLYEPYFVDVQKDIAQLIATILIYYSSLTSAPRDSLLQLKGIGEQAVDKCIDYMSRPGQQARQQRALVLDLLRDYKGVSISEQGRITKSVRTVRKEVSKMQQEFVKEQAEPELDGIAKLFGS